VQLLGQHRCHIGSEPVAAKIAPCGAVGAAASWCFRLPPKPWRGAAGRPRRGAHALRLRRYSWAPRYAGARGQVTGAAERPPRHPTRTNATLAEDYQALKRGSGWVDRSLRDQRRLHGQAHSRPLDLLRSPRRPLRAAGCDEVAGGLLFLRRCDRGRRGLQTAGELRRPGPSHPVHRCGILARGAKRRRRRASGRGRHYEAPLGARIPWRGIRRVQLTGRL